MRPALPSLLLPLGAAPGACKQCGKKLPPTKRRARRVGFDVRMVEGGRLREYCDANCRQRAKRARDRQVSQLAR